MSSYEIRWKRSTLKELKRLPKSTLKRVLPRIEALTSNPRPKGARKLVGSERIRVGDYRIAYEVQNDKLVVFVLRLAHRSDVYRRI